MNKTISLLIFVCGKFHYFYRSMESCELLLITTNHFGCCCLHPYNAQTSIRKQQKSWSYTIFAHFNDTHTMLSKHQHNLSIALKLNPIHKFIFQLLSDRLHTKHCTYDIESIGSIWVCIENYLHVKFTISRYVMIGARNWQMHLWTSINKLMKNKKK